LIATVAEPVFFNWRELRGLELPALLKVGLNQCLLWGLVPLPVNDRQLRRAGLKGDNPAERACLLIVFHPFNEGLLHHEKAQRTLGAPPIQAVFVEIKLSCSGEQRCRSATQKFCVSVSESLTWHRARRAGHTLRDGASLDAVEHCRQMQKWTDA